MKHIEKKIIEKLKQYDSISIGYIDYINSKLEIGFTSYMDDDFVSELYALLGSVLSHYKTQTVNITIVDVNDGMQNPLDAVATIEL